MTRQQEFSDRTVERLDALVDSLRAENEQLRAALKPFAAYAPDGRLNDTLPDDMVITKGSGMARPQLTLGDVRAAKAALSVKKVDEQRAIATEEK